MNDKTIKKLLSRNSNTHKGKSGHILVIAGSYDYVGAAILSSVSALRIGSDLVTLACPEKVGLTANIYCPDLITLKLYGKNLDESHYNTIIKDINKYDTILIGNGIGKKPSTKKLIIKLLKNKKFQSKNKVIDANAIKFVKIQDLSNTILTPHQNEFKTLMKNSNIQNKLQLKKSIGNNVILLKEKNDKIITKSKDYINKTGNPGMAKAGTGDVLAGLCAGILGKTNNLVESSKASAYISGKIGDILLKKKKGYFYIASDMLDEINRINKLFTK
ncbi:MAG: NAD(P)H-hydrate dehydratase [Candidatus Woesearchaeota archaeon]